MKSVLRAREEYAREGSLAATGFLGVEENEGSGHLDKTQRIEKAA